MQQLYAPPLSRVNKILLITVGASFVLQTALSLAAGINLTGLLGLSPAAVFSGHVYQIVTYPLVQSGLMGALFNGLVVWFIGSDLEQRWGERTYIGFLLASFIGAALLFLVVTAVLGKTILTPLVGLSGVCYSLLLAYAIIFPDRQLIFMFLFPLKARIFCALLIGIEFYMVFTSPYRASGWGHLAAMATGYGYLYFRSFSLKRAKSQFDDSMRKRRIEKRKRDFYIVKDEDDGDDKKNDPRFFQ